ncbi:thiol-disulfide oxidoreductase DCC family protein [Kaistella carnis]|uniref:thiol-disulfide oxidoreductase DCC family protein n=1 Tax=Kaistella carnis TaxID=1241979 RepID=UPI002898F34D|nr:DCC1-like thiol-disulfide oxidoreductase family protein [Kaistella carnis]
MNNYNNVVLYDGDCGFCNFWVQWILNNDSYDRFQFASLQSEYGQNFLKNQELPTDIFDTLYFIKDGMYYKKKLFLKKLFQEEDGIVQNYTNF